jgi:DNA-directed RNA polymerase specialized sigma24 family protein
VQEALTQAFASKRLPSDPAAFVRYVRAMARNIARKTAAQKKKAAALFDEDAFANEEDDEEERAGARHEVARVMAEEASTADPQAFGWMVRHVGGETYEEIARATTLKTEGVRARIRRLREALVVSRARARAGGEGAKGTDEARRIDDDR